MQKYYVEQSLAYQDVGEWKFLPLPATGTHHVYLASEVDALREAARKYIAAANPIVEKHYAENGHRLTDDPDYDTALTALQSFL